MDLGGAIRNSPEIIVARAMPDKVSVILTCYKGQNWIGQTIDSVLGQDHRDIELLIVNDASPDDSGALLQNYSRHDSRIRILTNPTNQGIPASRNRGITEMKGAYFCILDQDDLWTPGKASRQLQYLKEHLDIHAVYCGVGRVNAEGRLIGERNLPEPKAGNLFVPFFSRGVAPPLLSFMFRTALLQRTGPFNKALIGHDDFEFLLRVSHSTPIGFIPEVLVHQRYRPGTFGQSEAMVFDQLRLADLLMSTWPQFRHLARRYRSKAHYNTAHWLARNNQIKQARSHFLRSAFYQPLFWKGWPFWISAVIPTAVRKVLPRKLRLSP